MTAIIINAGLSLNQENSRTQIFEEALIWRSLKRTPPDLLSQVK